MSTPLLRPQSAPLRFIAVRLHIPELEQVVRQPGVGEALRITVQYHDGRHPDQVATLTKSLVGTAALKVFYRRTDNGPMNYDYHIEAERMQTLTASLRRLNFDKLDDAPDIPWFGADLWLVERAAGSFHHDTIIAPDKTTGVHAEVVKLIQINLREAVRPINP
jgi:hypothetical protein